MEPAGQADLEETLPPAASKADDPQTNRRRVGLDLTEDGAPENRGCRAGALAGRDSGHPRPLAGAEGLRVSGIHGNMLDIERNLYMRNSRPCRPTRVGTKKTG